MGFFKDKFKKRRESHENGYVSFTQEDLKENMQANPANEEAYGFLDAAMCTSSNITAVDENNLTVDVDDIYPCSEAECDEMDHLLDQAKAAVKDPNDKFFHERYGELRDIVDWSRKKHWTFKWVLILGCLLSIFIIFILVNQAVSDKRVIERKVEKIKNWEKQDTTIVFEECRAWSSVKQTDSVRLANKHKEHVLACIKGDYEYHMDQLPYHQRAIDTVDNRDQKKYHKEQLQYHEDMMKQYKKEYEDVNDMKFKAYRKYALKLYKSELRSARWMNRIAWILLFYVLLLTPFYIYSSHQYGYYITRYRAESAKLDKLQKWGFTVASFFLGAGLAMALLPDTKVTTIYSGGRTETHTESNPLNMMILCLKMILLAIAACVFSFVCIFIMSYVTIAAFKRNHDWSKVSAATATLKSKATEMAGKAGEVAKKAANKAVEVANEKIQQHKELKDGNSEDSKM